MQDFPLLFNIYAGTMVLLGMFYLGTTLGAIVSHRKWVSKSATISGLVLLIMFVIPVIIWLLCLYGVIDG